MSMTQAGFQSSGTRFWGMLFFDAHRAECDRRFYSLKSFGSSPELRQCGRDSKTFLLVFAFHLHMQNQLPKRLICVGLYWQTSQTLDCFSKRHLNRGVSFSGLPQQQQHRLVWPLAAKPWKPALYFRAPVWSLDALWSLSSDTCCDSASTFVLSVSRLAQNDAQGNPPHPSFVGFTASVPVSFCSQD